MHKVTFFDPERLERIQKELHERRRFLELRQKQRDADKEVPSKLTAVTEMRNIVNTTKSASERNKQLLSRFSALDTHLAVDSTKIEDAKRSYFVKAKALYPHDFDYTANFASESGAGAAISRAPMGSFAPGTRRVSGASAGKSAGGAAAPTGGGVNDRRSSTSSAATRYSAYSDLTSPSAPGGGGGGGGGGGTAKHLSSRGFTHAGLSHADVAAAAASTASLSPALPNSAATVIDSARPAGGSGSVVGAGTSGNTAGTLPLSAAAGTGAAAANNNNNNNNNNNDAASAVSQRSAVAPSVTSATSGRPRSQSAVQAFTADLKAAEARAKALSEGASLEAARQAGQAAAEGRPVTPPPPSASVAASNTTTAVLRAIAADPKHVDRMIEEALAISPDKRSQRIGRAVNPNAGNADMQPSRPPPAHPTPRALPTPQSLPPLSSDIRAQKQQIRNTIKRLLSAPAPQAGPKAPASNFDSDLELENLPPRLTGFMPPLNAKNAPTNKPISEVYAQDKQLAQAREALQSFPDDVVSSPANPHDLVQRLLVCQKITNEIQQRICASRTGLESEPQLFSVVVPEPMCQSVVSEAKKGSDKALKKFSTNELCQTFKWLVDLIPGGIIPLNIFSAWLDRDFSAVSAQNAAMADEQQLVVMLQKNSADNLALWQQMMTHLLDLLKYGHISLEKLCVVYAPAITPKESSLSQLRDAEIRLERTVSGLNQTADSLVQLLEENNFSLLYALCDINLNRDGDALASALITILEVHSRTLPALCAVMRRTVLSAVGPSAVTSAESLSMRMLVYYFRTVGAHYLESTIAPIVRNMFQEVKQEVAKDFRQVENPVELYPLEIHPNMCPDKTERAMHQNKMESFLTTILQTLSNSMTALPLQLRVLSHWLYEVVELAHPGLGAAAVSDLFFNRFICHAFLTPKTSGLIDEFPSAHASRAFVVMSQVLSHVPLGKTFSDSEDSSTTAFLSCMNSFISSAQFHGRAFLDNLSKPILENDFSHYPQPRASFSDGAYSEQLRFLHSLISDRMASITIAFKTAALPLHRAQSYRLLHESLQHRAKTYLSPAPVISQTSGWKCC